MWLSREIHLASINSPFPSGVDTADQYRWFTKLFFHSPTISQSFSFAKAVIFLRNAVYENKSKMHTVLSQRMRLVTYTLPCAKCHNDDQYSCQSLSNPLCYLLVAISHKCTNLEFLLSEKLCCSNKALLLHMIASFHFITLHIKVS